MKVSPARKAAFDVLFRIETERAFSSILLPFVTEKLSDADRGLCYEITLGVLRRQILLDRTMDVLARGRKIDPEVRIALRIGLYQMLYLDKVPDHAVINESVELTVRAKKRSAKSFVNAVLRNAQRELPSITFTDEIEKISIEESHPGWLVEKWIGQFGFEQAASICKANNRPPLPSFRLTPRFLRANSVAIGDREKIISIFQEAADVTIEPSDSVEGAYRVLKMTDGLSELAKKGHIYFQDEASQLAARSVEISDHQRFLDVCAAPGGKTTLVAGRSVGKNVLLAAGDLHQARVEQLKENCSRQEADVKIVRYDAEKGLPFADGTFDIILVDAPCSGTGTIKHNPEIRYTLDPDDLVELSNKQHNILISASKCLKPGGSLIYSTCSLEPEENEEVIGKFLKESPSFHPDTQFVPERFLEGEYFARTYPNRDDMDGFFIAKLIHS